MEDPAPTIILNANFLDGEVTNFSTYVKLLKRVIKKTKASIGFPFPGQDYKKLAFRMHRYGPYTICWMIYRKFECKIEGCSRCEKCTYSGYGLATRSHRDPEHEQAGVNIAFTRAATQLFHKYTVQFNKYAEKK